MSLLRRLLVMLGQLALLLPFVTLRSCATHQRTTLTGVELVTRGGGPWLLVAALVAAGFLWRPVASVRAIGEPLRALGAALAACTVLGALLFAGMFDGIEPRVGFALAFGSWLGLWISCLAIGFRPPFGWALGLMAAVPGVIGAALNLTRDDPRTAAGALGVTTILVVPLVPLFGALEGRARSAAWWVGAALALASGLVARPAGIAFTAVGVAAALVGAWLARGLHRSSDDPSR